MALLDRAVIARHPDAVPRLTAFVTDLAEPAGLAAGTHISDFTLVAWHHDGDHLRLELGTGDAARDLAVMLRPRDADAAAFIRTERWNISYRGDGFGKPAEALLGEVGKRLEQASVAADLDVAGLLARYFIRPGHDDYLELTPGRKIYIRVTDHCDENCIFCNATEGNANIIASRKVLRDLLTRLPTGELTQVIFTGGEPTLLSNLPELVGLVYERGARQIILQTNGIRLAEPGALEAYLPWRDRFGIGFSLHAADPALSDQMTGAAAVPRMPLGRRHDPARGGLADSDVTPPLPITPSGRFASKIKAIDRCVELGFRFKITCVVMRPNLEHLPAMARWAADRYGDKLHRFHISYAMPRGRAWMHAGEMASFTECQGPFRAAVAIGREANMRVEFSQAASLPPCQMVDCLDCYDCYGEYSGGATAGPGLVKPAETCTGCALDNMCPGVWQRYLDVHGSSELRAVKDRAPPVLHLDNFGPGEILELKS